MSKARIRILFITTVIALLGVSQTLTAQFRGARDPGVRGGPPGAGGAIAGLSGEENTRFEGGLAGFSEEESVPRGVGPRFNFRSRAGCPAEPATRGKSPPGNPRGWGIASDLWLG